MKALIILTFLFMHPLHMTLTSINQVSGTDSLRVLVKMNYDLFIRDYQTIDDDRNVDIYRNKPFPQSFAYSYLQTKIAIYIDNKLLYGKLLSMDVTGGEISINLLYRLEKKPKKIKVRNTFLTSLYSDAENYTMITIGNMEEDIKMTSDDTEKTFKIK
ncbi:MAG: DUF6702 family protein [Bacteroidales bacterium]